MKTHSEKARLQLLRDMKNYTVSLIRGSKKDQYRKDRFSKLYRHLHIAHCLLAGKSLKEVERTNREGHAPVEKQYLAYMNMDEKSPWLKASEFKEVISVVGGLHFIRAAVKRNLANPWYNTTEDKKHLIDVIANALISEQVKIERGKEHACEDVCDCT